MDIIKPVSYQTTFTRKPSNYLKSHQSEIKQMIASGIPVAQIAKDLDTNALNLYRFLRTIGVNPTCKFKKAREVQLNEKILENIKLFIDKNLSLETIATLLNCSVQEINNCLNLNGYKIKSLLRLEMFKSGMTPKQVAIECGISREWALKIKNAFQKEKLLPPDEPSKRVDSIKKDIKEGMKTKVLAKKYELSPSSIYRYRKLGGITPELIAENRKNQILVMAREGLGVRAMAKELGVSEEVVKKIIKTYDLKPQITAFRENIEDRILADAKRGVFLEKLAEIYGYSERTISNKLKRAREREKLKSII